MAYAEYSEFPHTRYDGDNNWELLHVYKEVREKYQATLDNITALQQRLNNWEQNGNNIISQQLTTQSKALQASYEAKVQQLQQNFDINLQSLNTKVTDTLNSTVESLMQNVNNRFTNMQQDVNKSIADFKSMVSTDNIEFKSSVKELIESITVANKEAQSNIITAVQKELDNMKELLREKNTSSLVIEMLMQYSYNCKEWYDATEVTCTVWNQSGITCLTWIGSAKYIFGYFRECMRSPLTGRLETVQQVITDLIQQLKVESLTAEEYDRLGLTAEEYDTLFIKANNYDWSGKYVFR